MNFWRRKSAVPAAQAVQLRGREQHPFTGLRGFTPQRSGELRLYQAVREAVPVVDAAVCKLIRLSGGVQVSCEDAKMDGRMRQFLERVPVGRGQFGINAFLEQYLDHPEPENQPRAEALSALHPAAPWSILAITFTNKAANELKARLQALLGDYAMDVWAMTFHAACCRILRREIDRLDGYTGRFTIYDTSDSERVMKDILKDFGLDEKSLPPRLVLSVISKAKDKRQNPELFSRHAGKSGDYRMDRIAQLYAEYEKRLHEANALDFDDIILKTVELLEQFEDVRTYYQRKFHYVMIDEYQDTNQLQYQLTALLAGGYENICVVGDDDQSIYKFRGATIENILSFEKQFKGARVIRLEQNYRSTQAILNAANAVISHNRGRKGKKLWTQNAAGDRITVYEASSESDEANYIASRIISMSKGKNFKDFAVLYRTNAQSNAVENAFKRSGIPYRIIGGTRFFDRAEVKDMLAYLCVINNRADELRLQRIINNPPRGIGGKTLEMAQRQAAAAGVPLYTVVSDPYSYPSLEKSAAKLMAFTVVIEECAELLTTLSLPDFYEEVMLRTGYLNMLEEKDDIEARTRAENIRELKSSILAYMENTDTPTLVGFLEEIALYTDIEQYDPEADAVVMMTMHAAKGLEFPNVYLTGLEEGVFPGYASINADDPDELEEERRLCYVGITRAMKRLTITCAKQRMVRGETQYYPISRFIREIPIRLVQTGREQVKTEQPAKKMPDVHSPYMQAKKAFKSKAFDPNQFRVKKADSLDYTVGDQVRHIKFGVGTVENIIDGGKDYEVTVNFEKVGVKKMFAAFAKLKKV